jgi:hypothetical protein
VVGIAYATLIAAFTLSGFVFQPVQAFTGFALAAATAYLAIQLPRTHAVERHVSLPGRAGQRRAGLLLITAREPECCMTRTDPHQARTLKPPSANAAVITDLGRYTPGRPTALTAFLIIVFGVEYPLVALPILATHGLLPGGEYSPDMPVHPTNSSACS